MKIVNQVKFELLSIPENVAFARVSVAAFAVQLDFTLNDLDEIKVAVSEAVSNSIIHGYNQDPNKTIRITATIYNNNNLEIIVEDEGVGIKNIDEAIRPSFSSDDERMGLGFVFMQSFMDSFHVDSLVNSGTKVTMVKKFDPNASLQLNKDS